MRVDCGVCVCVLVGCSGLDDFVRLVDGWF